jgi:hypothetical protein
MTEVELKEVVERGVESDVLDYKAAQNWNQITKAGRAKLVRHMIAFANTKGGCLVIGVGEDSSGCPRNYTGVSDEESKSFDPSVIGSFIAQMVEPPIDFYVERPVINNKTFIVIVVRPFSQLPHVCKADIELVNSNNEVERELRSGVFYIRTKGASSTPARTANELHGIIQRALRNQRQLLGQMIRRILFESNKEDKLSENIDLSHAVLGAEIFFKRRRYIPNDKVAILRKFSVVPVQKLAGEYDFLAIKENMLAALDEQNQDQIITEHEITTAYHSGVSLRSLPEGKLKMWQAGNDGLFVYCDYMIIDSEDKVVKINSFENFTTNIIDFASRYYSMFHGEDPKRIFSISLELTFESSGITLENKTSINKSLKALGQIEVTAEDLVKNPIDCGKDILLKLEESLNLIC